MKGSITIVGLGPGSEKLISTEVQDAISNASDIVGYKNYVNRIAPRKEQNIHSSDNKFEISRAELAVKLALDGKRVVIVSSGDPKDVIIYPTFSSQQTVNCSLYKKLDLFTIKLMPKGLSLLDFISWIAFLSSSVVLKFNAGIQAVIPDSKAWMIIFVFETRNIGAIITGYFIPNIRLRGVWLKSCFSIM